MRGEQDRAPRRDRCRLPCHVPRRSIEARALACSGSPGRNRHGRGVAQPGSASHWGCEGRRFESCRPDQHRTKGSAGRFPFLMLASAIGAQRRCFKDRGARFMFGASPDGVTDGSDVSLTMAGARHAARSSANCCLLKSRPRRTTFLLRQTAGSRATSTTKTAPAGPAWAQPSCAAASPPPTAHQAHQGSASSNRRRLQRGARAPKSAAHRLIEKLARPRVQRPQTIGQRHSATQPWRRRCRIRHSANPGFAATASFDNE